MRLTSLLGFIAGALTTISFVPQVLHAWRSKRCDDLSWAMLLTFSAGVVLWLAYGIRLWAMPIIVANAVTLALLLIIMALKARYARAENLTVAENLVHCAALRPTKKIR
jgi:MtN3 and saliva related transmembrane protein